MIKAAANINICASNVLTKFDVIPKIVPKIPPMINGRNSATKPVRMAPIPIRVTMINRIGRWSKMFRIVKVDMIKPVVPNTSQI